jgi:prolyl-tRNA synthetase
MNWYIAKIVYNISINNGKHNYQFEEHLKLVQAQTSFDAFSKAKLLGKQGEYSFNNENGQLVQWKLIDVAEVVAIGNKLEHGMEVYSSVREECNVDDFVNYIKQKALIIQKESLIFV